MKQGIFMRNMAAESEEAIVDIVGIIGWEVGLQQIRAVLSSIPESVKRVTFDIYSPGGDVWEGNGIIHEIGGMKQHTVARIQVAASMATLIAVACKERVIAANGRFLVHNAWTHTTGDAAAHEKRAKELRDCEIEAAKFYASRTGKTEAEMIALMAEERWLTAEETKAFGFATSVNDPFAEKDFESVRQAITEAGKWPKALVEIPAPKQAAPTICASCSDSDCENCQDGKCTLSEMTCGASGACSNIKVKEGQDDATAEGASGDAPVAAVHSDASSDEGNASRIEQALLDGVASGKAAAVEEYASSVEKLTATNKAQAALIAKLQSEKDKAESRAGASEKASDDRCRVLREQLELATARLSKFVDAAASFSPSVETWAEAMAACGGDYANAAKQYPDLRKRYDAENKQKKVR